MIIWNGFELIAWGLVALFFMGVAVLVGVAELRHRWRKKP